MRKVKALWLTIVVGLAVTTVQAEQFKAFEIASADTVSAKVVFSRNYPVSLEVILEQRKARELENLTRTNLNNNIVITINGEAIAEPTVRETVSDGIIRIPVDDERAAIRLAKSLTIQSKKTESSSGENLR